MSISSINSLNASNYLLGALNAIDGVNPTAPTSLNAVLGLNDVSSSVALQFSTLSQVMSAADTLESAALALTQGTAFGAQTANSSAPAIVAGAATGVPAGNYAVQVTQLAQAETLLSGTVAGGPAAPIGSGTGGTLNVQYANGTSQTVNLGNGVGSGANTLGSISAAINHADIGVTASLLTTSAGTQLQLTGQSGLANAFSVTASDPAVSQLFNTASGSATVSVNAQDSQGLVNGVGFSGSTNVDQTDVPGLSLMLAAVGNANLTVAPASGQLAGVQTFVQAFNRLQGLLQQLSQSSPTLEASLLPLQTTLDQAISQNQSALADVGITQNQNGNLSLNQTTFQNALNSNENSVANVFSHGGVGVADTVLAQTEQALSPQNLLQLTNSAFSNTMLLDDLLGTQSSTPNLSSAALSVLASSSFNGQQLNSILAGLTDNALLSNLLSIA